MDISRREFLRVSALATAAGVVAACAAPTEPEVEPTAAPVEPAAPVAPTTVPAAAPGEGGKFAEAPELATLVSEGSLGPVEDRLPADPLVITPLEKVGQYGGTWRQANHGDTMGWFRMTNNVESFLRWNETATGHVANLLASWTWNDDATELTANLRKGIKWSDGEPLTVDDYLFWWEDMVLDESVPVSEPSGTRAGGELVTVAKVDDYTLTYTFAVPNPLFLEYHSRGYYHSAWFTVPAHYMKQFHPKYNEALAADDTNDLVTRYDYRDQYPDMPTFTAWQVVDYRAGERGIFERNPYYWKVDTEGNQLPYIGTVDITDLQNKELVTMMATAGDLDCQVRDFSIKDVPLLNENAEKGGYRVLMWNRGDFGWPAILIGYDYPDEEIVELMYDKRFRQALSWAINRERINDIVALGLATPRQAALSSAGPEFQTPEGQKVFQDWASSYAEYQPDTATSLLDEIGVVDNDGDGWRERPSGDPLELIVDVSVTDQQSVDATDLIKEDWEAIGLKTTMNVIEGTLLSQRATQGEYMLYSRGSNCAWGLVSAPPHWTPIEFSGYAIAPRIGQYYQTGGRQGIAPRPGSMLERLQDAYTELIEIKDPVERTAKLLDAYRIHIDEGPINIGTIADHPSPVVVANNFRNVPEMGYPGSWDLGFPGTVRPEQFFFES